MTDALKRKWDSRYGEGIADDPPTPSRVLSENARILPRGGAALDLACGLGGNALFLARRGLSVTAWDISPVAIGALERYSRREHLCINADVRNIDDVRWDIHRFDVIVVSHYLDRALAPSLSMSLSARGLLFFQTYTAGKLTASGPHNPAYLLNDNELPSLFPSLRIRYYREDSRCGSLDLGLRDEAYYVGEKP